MEDEKNPEMMFNGIDNELLLLAVNGKLDVMKYIKERLADQGINDKGKWVGVSVARSQFGLLGRQNV